MLDIVSAFRKMSTKPDQAHHGSATKYAGGYPSHTLRAWADWLAEMIRNGKDVCGYFNNDVGGHAPRDALTLHRYLSTLTARAS